MRSQFVTMVLTPLLLLSSFTLAFPSPSSTTPTLKPVYEFPNPTWVENLAVRSNGNILVTILTAPEVWEINPFAHTAELIYHFPNAVGVSGIAEVEKDVFTVAVGNWSDVTFKATFESYSVWSIDLKCDDAKVQKVTDMKKAQFSNGMTALPTLRDTVLIGDADLGVIWRLNAKTGVYGVAIDNSFLKPNASAAIELGVNGIHYRNGYLYFVNTFSVIYARIPLHTDGSAAGPVESISTSLVSADDFAIDRKGNAWITTDPNNSLIKITPKGKVTPIVGAVNETTLLGPTAAAFGRTSHDLDILYITTNGGIGNPPASGIEGGRVWALDTSML